jgi:hypothetical protein
MRTSLPVVLEDDNLSHAWGKVFLHSYADSDDAAPVVLSVKVPETGPLPEDPTIRIAVDKALAANDKVSVAENSCLIFPQRTWERCRSRGREDFYKDYISNVLPRLKGRDRKNWFGTYFARMIGYEGFRKTAPKYVNQLEHIIQFWKKGRSAGYRLRTTALQVACFDPAKDHSFSRLRVFPCLQQVSFAYQKEGNGLVISALYPCQYIFERAYGNYLGLINLGRFMANEMGLPLVRMNCFISAPLLGAAKRDLVDVKNAVNLAVTSTTAAGG